MRCLIILATGLSLMAAIPSQAQLQEPAPGATTNMLTQIAAYKAELASLTTAQKKLTSSLVEAVREHKNTGPRRSAPKMRSGLRKLAGDKVLVDIKAAVSEQLLANIRALGGVVKSSYPQYDAINAEVPLATLESIAALPQIKSIAPNILPICNVGTKTSEGDVAHGANLVRSTYGATGAGVKVGVMSDSDRFIEQSQANHDLGSVNVLYSGQDAGNNTGEGTAMMEIVHDIAPDAQLYFAGATITPEGMASNILALANAGCNIIIDDITFEQESPFQDGVIAQAVQTVSDQGILYFSSAANNGNLTSGTSGTWEGDFSPTNSDPRYGTGALHNWGGTVFNQISIYGTNVIDVSLAWADPFAAAQNSYNLFIVDNKGNLLGTGVHFQGLDNSPLVAVGQITNNMYAVVELASGSPRYIRLEATHGKFAFGTGGSTYGHNASAAGNAFSVAATTAHNFTSRFTGGTNNPVETFSSDGYRRMFFYPDGTPITANNFSSSGGQIFFKPDITAADGVLASTNTFGTNSEFYPFYGTSAAAPHAGAIAALLKSYRPNISAGDIRTALTTTSLDIEATGSDRDSGHGIIMADLALASIVDTNAPTVTISYPTNGQVITSGGFAQFIGTAMESPSGVSSVTAILTYDNGTSFVYWNGSSYSSSSATLPASFDGTNWTISNLPSGSNFKNGNYSLSVEAGSGTVPPVTANAIANFRVDFHPSFTWTAGSYQIPNITPDNDWNNPLNWYEGSVPTPDSIAFVPPSSASPVSTTAISLYALNVSAGATMPSLVVTQLNLSGGVLTVTNILINVGGVFNWGDATVSGTCEIPAGATLNFINAGNIALSSTAIYSSGNINWTGTGQINLAAGDVIVTGGTFTLASDAALVNFTGGLPMPAVVNNGLIVKTAGTNSLFSPVNGGVALTNFGTVNIKSGTLTLGGGGVATNSTFVVTNGTHVDLLAGSMEFDQNQIINGPGSVRVTGAILTCNNSTVTFTNNGAFEVVGGQFYGTNAFVRTGTFNWLGGLISAALTAQPTVTFNIGGVSDKTLAGGTITTTGPGSINGAGRVIMAAGSSIINSGTLSVQSDVPFINYTGGSPQPFISNTGTWAKTAGTNTPFDTANGSIAFNNYGTLNVQSGAISLNGGGVSSNAIFIAGSGCLIDFAGGSFEIDGATSYLGSGTNRFSGATGNFGGGINTLNGGTFAVSDGSISGMNVFVGSGNFNWSGGAIGGTPTSMNLRSTNINFNILGTTDKTFSGATFANSGPGSWTNRGNLDMTAGAVWINSGAFTVLDDGPLFNTTGGSPAPLIVNNGSWIKTAGTNSIVNPANGGVMFDNYGTLATQSGTIVLNGGGVSSNATFFAAGSCLIDFAGGTFELDGLTSFGGGGTNRFSGSVATFGGGSNNLSGANIELSGGSIGGSAAFGGFGIFNWSGGFLSGNMSLKSLAINFNLVGDADKTLSGGTLTEAGTGSWTGNGNLNVSAGSTLTTQNAFTILTDASVFNNTGGTPQPQIVNTGTWVKAAGTNTSFLSVNNGVSFNNHGTLSSQSGIVSLGGGGGSSGGSYSANASCHIDLSGGAFELDGNLTFNGAGSTRVNGATVNFGGGTSTLTTNGTFEFDGGTLSGASIFVGAGAFNWNGGSESANLNLHSGVALNVASSADKSLAGGTLTSAGTGSWSGTGIWNATAGSVFNNTGTFTVLNDSQVFNSTGGSPSPLFVNNGSFIKAAGTNTSFSPVNSGVSFNNHGTLSSQSGTISLGGGGTGSGGTYSANSGCHIDLLAGAFELDGNSAFSGAGSIRVNGATVNFGAGTSALTTNGTFEFDGGILTGASTFAGAGAFNWNGGSEGANLNLQSGVALNIGGATDKTLNGGTLTNGGAGSWSGTGALNTTAGAVFNNTGTFTVLNDSQLINITGGSPLPLFVNNGNFVKAAGTNTVFSSLNGGTAFTNNGIVNLQTGAVTFNAGYTSSAASQLQVAIGGITPVAQFGQEFFAQPLNVNGGLTVTLKNSFVPTNGQSFAILNYPSSTGQFSTKQLPALAQGSTWNVSYGGTATTLTVVRQIALSGLKKLSNGHAQFLLDGPNASSALILGSTNLIDWVALLTNAPFIGTLNFDDPAAVGQNKKFYQIKITP